MKSLQANPANDSILIRPNYVLLNAIYNVQQALRATLNRLISWANQRALSVLPAGGRGRFLLVSLWERLAPDAWSVWTTWAGHSRHAVVRGCGGALINRNLGASGALEIAHTPRVPVVIQVKMGSSDSARLQYDDKFFRLLHWQRWPLRGGAGVVNAFDKWLPFFNVTFCGHATQQSGRWRRVALRWFHWPMKRKFWNWNHE